MLSLYVLYYLQLKIYILIIAYTYINLEHTYHVSKAVILLLFNQCMLFSSFLCVFCVGLLSILDRLLKIVSQSTSL